MSNSAQPLRAVNRENQSPRSRRRPHRSMKRAKMHNSCQLGVTAVPAEARFRLTVPAQFRIIALRNQGHSWSEISRRTRHARETCRKVVRCSPEIQDKMRQLKEQLISESDDWLESINFAVTHETDGRLGYRLCQAFAVIPTIDHDASASRAGSSRRKLRV
jgi:hypothetical protein